MAINLTEFCCVLLMLCGLHDGVHAKRRQPRPSSDLLVASSISLLTELVTDQANKITSITTKLDEARAEIEQLKSKLSTSQSKIELLEGKQVELADAASSLKNESKAGAEELKSELSTALSKMDGLDEKQVELANAASLFKNESKTEVEGLKSAVTTSQNKIESLERVAEEASWPEGSYCILGSGGSCPEGFTGSQGYTKAIWTYRNSGYTQAATFGDSKIGCHNSCSSTSTYWNVDIIITSCCK